MSTPRPTAVVLLATLAATAAALAAFLLEAPLPAAAYLTLFTALFLVRVAGQVGVALARPAWLPPMDEWNIVPYRVLLPAQLVILALMAATVTVQLVPGAVLGRVLMGLALVYSAVMALRYCIRMARRPSARWLGGTIPIVFHCVLAAFLFVLGASHA
jgi:hypothetical protein